MATRPPTTSDTPAVPRELADWLIAHGRHWVTSEEVAAPRLVVEIARDSCLGGELVFRGGTCLHKLYADEVYRYSEDVDHALPMLGSGRRWSR